MLFSLSYLKGEFFTAKTVRRVMATSRLAVIYPADGFLRLIDGNWAAGDLVLSTWLQRNHTDFYQHLGIRFVPAMIISTLGIMLFRAARIQEGQERLIQMARIACHLDELLESHGMMFAALSEQVGVIPVNLSMLKNNRAKAIRFTTLTMLCEALDCQLGDLFSVGQLCLPSEKSRDARRPMGTT